MVMTALYTRLYVNSALSTEHLLRRVAEVISGSVGIETVVSEHVEVDVRANDDFDPKALHQEPRDFIHFSYSVEVETRIGLPLGSYLSIVGQLMRGLSDVGASVVASCEWEERLPGSGRLGPAFEV